MSDSSPLNKREISPAVVKCRLITGDNHCILKVEKQFENFKKNTLKFRTIFLEIRYAVLTSSPSMHLLFPDTFHQARSSQPDKQLHTEAPHGNPGTLYTC